MKNRKETKYDKGQFVKSKTPSDSDKIAMYDYYEAGLKTGKSSEDLLAELEELYNRSTRQIQRYIAEIRNEQKPDIETEIGSIFGRDPRTAKKAVESYKPNKRQVVLASNQEPLIIEAKREIPGTTKGNEHEKLLRQMIHHLINCLSNLSSPVLAESPTSFILPITNLPGDIARAHLRIENDPVFQALMEHLKDTEIPNLWKDAETVRLEFVIANANCSISSSDPEVVRREQAKIDAIKNRKDSITLRNNELTISLWQKLKELLLDKLPGKCPTCPDI